MFGTLASGSQKVLALFVARKLEFCPRDSASEFGRELHVARARIQIANLRALGEMVYPNPGSPLVPLRSRGQVQAPGDTPDLDMGWWTATCSFGPP